MHKRGFTLIELLVVLAIVALLVTIVSPRYFRSVDRAKETSLRTSLKTMRDAIDKFAADQGRYPQSLEELVVKHYLRDVPVDPLTRRKDGWVAVPPAADAIAQEGVAEVRSSAPGEGTDGVPFQEY